MKKAIVIGASSGIGKEIALILSKKGYEVGLMARRLELLDLLKSEITTQSYVSHIDLIQIEDAIEKVNRMIQTMNGVDLVVLNAGTGFLNPELDWHKEQETLDVNVYGFCAIACKIYNFFAQQGQGHLVGISSIGALRGSPISPAYSASKAFISNYIEGLRKKAFQENLPIIMTDIKPGFVETQMAKGEGKFWVASPKKAAEQIYLAISKKKSHAYITRRWQLIGMALQLMPDWLYRRM